MNLAEVVDLRGCVRPECAVERLQMLMPLPRDNREELFSPLTHTGRVRRYLRDHPGPTFRELELGVYGKADEDTRTLLAGSIGFLKHREDVYTLGKKYAYRYFLNVRKLGLE